MPKGAIQIVPDNLYLKRAVQFLAHAQSEILLTTYKLQISSVPRARSLTVIIHALTRAISQGVKCKIIVHYGPGKKGVPSANLPSMLMLHLKGAQVRYLPISRIVHAKILIVDSRIMMVGSHNWSISSMMDNAELSLMVEDSISISQAKDYFINLWNQATPFK